MGADDVIVALDQRFRSCHGRVAAALTRQFSVQRFALIENAVQDAYVRALERWPHEGTPAEPERWLVRVAHNAMIDALRREAPMRPLDASHEVSVDPPRLDSDDELRLMFLCSDPAISRAA
jgi:RNA polymerase sigma-70 factor (ECF subfamily)